MVNKPETFDVRANVLAVRKGCEQLGANHLVYAGHDQGGDQKLFVRIDSLMGNHLMTVAFNLNAQPAAVLRVLRAIDGQWGT